MDKKIALVSYYNTEPFLYGFEEKGEKFELIRSTPAGCTALFKSGEVDIALVPIVTLFEEEEASIISDYGICCDNKVETVMLYSNSPKDEITSIFLDNHSRTSVQLLRVILKNYWGLNPELNRVSVDQIDVKSGEGVLMIGDKVFTNNKKFSYVYDLGEEWKNFTGLPFVFAAWLKRGEVGPEIVSELKEIFEFGLANIPTIINKYKGKLDIDLKSYYENNIHFRLGQKEHKAITRFKEELGKINS